MDADGTDGGVRHRVALLGDAFVDINLSGLARLPQWGIDVPCAGVRLTIGGSCCNTARQLASLGAGSVRATFFSCVGGDSMGDHFRRSLLEEGLLADCDTSLHRLDDVPQSCCTILAGPEDRAMISCYSSNERVSIAPFRDALLGTPWALFHIGGYFNVAQCHDDSFLEVVRTLRARGTRVTLDPQHDASEQWGAGGHFARLLPYVDVFLPNEVELCHVTQTLLPLRADADAEGSAAAERTPEAALSALAAAFPHLLIVLTLGASGLRAQRGESEMWTEPAQPVTFVDATGAGDACAAGFLVQMLRDPDDVQAALRAGAAAGALCVSTAGACEKPIAPAALDGQLAGDAK
jgi:sugar/nucleoside kinase (ribokinase family)